MTISSTARKAGPFSGTGLQSAFPFNFKVFAASDVLVVQTDATGVEYELTLGQHYSVALNANQDANPGGQVTLPSSLPVGALLTISSRVALTQGASIPNMGGFYPKVIEQALDKLTITAQQTSELAGRALRFAFSDGSAAAALPTATARSGKFLAFDAGGNPVSASGTGADAALRTDLASPLAGSLLVSFLQNVLGAAKRTVLDVLRERVSLLDFMTDEQRAAVYSGATVDHTSAFSKAESYLTASNRTVVIPAGTYNFADTFDVPTGACVRIDPKAVLNFTSAMDTAIRIRRGVTFHGNGATLNLTNAAWNGDAVLLDGADKFVESTPTLISGLHINSAAAATGTGLHLRALNAGEYISFVKLRGFTFGSNLNYGFVVSCGNSGTTDPSSWHWINSNIFENFTFFYPKYCMSVVGMATTPAEVAANQFLNFHFQPGVGVPVYLYGAHLNTLTGYIWDWDNTQGSPIVFDGGAVWNTVYSNIDTSVVTSAGNNKVYDLTGGETGQKYFWGWVLNYSRTFFGRAGVSGQYAITWLPDVANQGQFHAKNDGTVLGIVTGGDPYTGTPVLNVRGDNGGNVVVGSSNANATVSTLRVNGAAGRTTSAFRMGADGYPAAIYENAAGTSVGSVVVNTSATTYNTSSDYRLKAQVAPLAGSGAFLDALRPVTWAWKIDGTPGVGFIAHELQAISPSSVHGDKDAVDEKGNPVYQSVEYGSAEVIANLVAELQSVRKNIASIQQHLNITPAP